MQEALACHCVRLIGLSGCPQALWPYHRAPQWFKGNGQGWIRADGSPGTSQERRPLDEDHQLTGAKGIDAIIYMKSVPGVSSIHGITARIVIATALALLNTHRTQTEEANLFPIRSRANLAFKAKKRKRGR